MPEMFEPPRRPRQNRPIPKTSCNPDAQTAALFTGRPLRRGRDNRRAPLTESLLPHRTTGFRRTGEQRRWQGRGVATVDNVHTVGVLPVLTTARPGVNEQAKREGFQAIFPSE